MAKFQALLAAAMFAAAIVTSGCVGERTLGVSGEKDGNTFSCAAGQAYAAAPCNIPCAPGSAGAHVCNSTGTALTSACRCVATGSPSTACSRGEIRGACTLGCTTASGGSGVTPGVMTCNSTLTAFECARTSGACMGSVCQAGIQTSCPCGGGATGTQVCNADGASYTSCACSSAPPPFCSTGQTNGACALSCSGGGSQLGMWTCNAGHDGWTCIANPGSTCSSSSFCPPGSSVNGACTCVNGTAGTSRTCNAAGTAWECTGCGTTGTTGTTCPVNGSFVTTGCGSCPSGSVGQQLCSGGYLQSTCQCATTGTTCAVNGMMYTTGCGSCPSGSIGQQLCVSSRLQDLCQCTSTGTGATCSVNGALVTTYCGSCPSGSIGQQLCSGGRLQDVCQCTTTGGGSSTGACANGAVEVALPGVCPACPGARAPIRVCNNFRWDNASTGTTNCDCAGVSAPPGLACVANSVTLNGCSPTTICSSAQTTGQQCSGDGRAYGGCICINR